MEIEKIKITDIKPAEYNPRQITSEELTKLTNSINEFGLVDPIIINLKNNKIIGGHQRYEVLINQYMLDNNFYAELNLIRMGDIGWIFTETDLKIESEDHEKALNLALNKISGEWDFEKLTELLDELDLNGFDISLSGFDGLDDLDFDLDGDYNPDEGEYEIEEDEYEIDEDIEVTVKQGDIYQLGSHKLLCGDSTTQSNVDQLLNGEKPDLIFTDPPYNMKVEGGSNQFVGKAITKVGEAIKDITDFEPEQFLGVCKNTFNKDNMNMYVFCNKDLIPDYVNWAVNNKYSFSILFWKKENAIPLGSQHLPDVEYIIFIRKNAIWNDGLRDTVSYSKCLEYSRENSTPHPTMKPVQLIANELQLSSNKSGIVLDLFGGSGSTLIACEEVDRRCYMMELDPYYCQVIINRWEEFTGEKAEKIEG